jgi:glycerol-3-phosphate dehydrogenase
VRLWGTWLDDALLDVCDRGEPRPRLLLSLGDLALFRSARLDEALHGAELVIQAVSSDGALPVMTKAAPFLPDVPILSVSKGFLEGSAKRMDRIDVVAFCKTALGGEHLYITATREAIGRGKPAREVASEMAAAGLLTEGYMAIATGFRFARERGVTDLPLLSALNAIVWEDADLATTLKALTLSA